MALSRTDLDLCWLKIMGNMAQQTQGWKMLMKTLQMFIREKVFFYQTQQKSEGHLTCSNVT